MHYQHLTLWSKQIPYIRRGTGPILFFLHGYGASLSHFEPGIELLANHYTVIAPEGFGLNNRTLPLRSMQACTELVEDFCTALDVEPSIIVGHSLGGWIALKIARRHQNNQTLILLNPLFPTNYGRWGFILRSGYKLLLIAIWWTAGFAGVWYFGRLIRMFIQNPSKYTWFSRELIDDIAHFPIESYDIPNQIYLLCSGKDEYFDVQKYRKILASRANITEKVYPNLSHDWPIFYPEFMAGEALKILKEIR